MCHRQNIAILLLLMVFSKSHAACSAAAQCRPLAQCSIVYQHFNPEEYSCDLGSGRLGLCCPEVAASEARHLLTARRSEPAQPGLQLPAGLTDQDIKQRLDSRSGSKRVVQSSPGSGAGAAQPSGGGHGLFKKIRQEDKPLVEAALQLSRLGADDFIGFEVRKGAELSVGLSAENSETVRDLCSRYAGVRCAAGERFRATDGSCNNQARPLLGMSRTPLQRILRAEYSGHNLPRAAKSGDSLPSARLASTSVLDEEDREDVQGISMYFVQMGQFIDHDITLSPAFEEPGQCCDTDARGRRGYKFPRSFDEEKCAPIEIPRDDPLWGSRGRRCYEFKRSVPSLAIPDCRVTEWEQMNALTHWLDASNVYGSTARERGDVREQRTQASPFLVQKTVLGRTGRALLPSCHQEKQRTPATRHITSCEEACTDDSRHCMVAGDQRANEQPGLATMHTLWFREHNRLAELLESMNGGKEDSFGLWDGERVFQEARRLLIAQWQHLIYQEWLPILLGQTFVRKYDLLPATRGYTTNYDPSIDPRINNEFSTAAFRFGHSMVAQHVAAVDSSFNNVTDFSLADGFFNSSAFRDDRNFVEKTTRGQIVEPAQAWDPAFNRVIKDELMDDHLDLVSLNIQRGRDHGIPGYNSYREACGIQTGGQYDRVDTFEQLTRGGFLGSSDVEKLRRLYEHVDDIDLFVAGVMEAPHEDALVGPVFKCIIGDQFIRLKEGDRFWYENGDDPRTRLTPAQLAAVKEASMARIVCDNTDISSIQPMVFRTESSINRITSCDDLLSIPKLDLEPWRV